MASRVVSELRHAASQIDEGVLHHILRRSVVETGIARHVVNQTPIGVEELSPALLILAVAQARQKALPRLQKHIARPFGGHVPSNKPSGLATFQALPSAWAMRESLNAEP